MTQASDLCYFVELDGERIELAGSLTFGRHLDNDLVIGGEDVLDYHLRIEAGERGPRAVPLGEASLRVNDQQHDHAVGLMPGDRLQVGRNALEIHTERTHPAEADSWRLHAAHDLEGCSLGTCLSVGRGDANDLCLDDDHISRYHARLSVHDGAVWLRDLDSANGTFVNGVRLAGACRLFHGDEIRFDALAHQLVGRGADLTPVREALGSARLQALALAPPAASLRSTDTTEFSATGPSELSATLPEPSEAGAFLLGASEPVSGLAFRLPMGRTVIGREPDCDLLIRDRTVSARHAELVVRAEGVTITNLMATNGTRVNGESVQSARLHDGDVLRLGRVGLVFKDVPVAEARRPWLRHAQLGLLGGSLMLTLVLLWMLS